MALGNIIRDYKAHRKWLEEAAAIIDQHIATRWKDASCRRCGTTDWIIYPGDKLTLTTVGLEDPDTREGLLTAALVCRSCGTTELLNMAIAGVPRKTE